MLESLSKKFVGATKTLMDARAKKGIGFLSLHVIAVLSLFAAFSTCLSQVNTLETRWTKTVTMDNVHPEYPRPQLLRNTWLNLNGLWDYVIKPLNSEIPIHFDGEILVPFPIESALSGVQEKVDGKALWYRRSFELPVGWSEQRILLHFGAVDWDTTVWLNGQEIGTHQGGYDAFSFDITPALREGQSQELVLRVFDATDADTQTRGKQVREPEGIWYTSTTGIWQTVWLEPVPDVYIANLKMESDIDAGVQRLLIEESGEADDGRMLRVTVFDNGEVVTEARGAVGDYLELSIPNAKLWSPTEPFLYDLDIKLENDDGVIDRVQSYFGMRKISVERSENGIMQLHLNNEPLFHYGLLDQGFWPDGLYTAPTDEALRYDIEVTKQLGFNTIRKHVKIEPDRWYYWTDKLGVLVWQDMPSGDAFVGRGQGEITRSVESATQFEKELEQLVKSHYNHPSIVMWVPFNEGWGQYDTVHLTNWLKELDPTRLINPASGWNDMQVGDVLDIHSYPGPEAAPINFSRAVVLGEFGGLGLAIANHTWQDEANWGYQQFQNHDDLTDRYLNLVNELKGLIETQGLAAAIYTQTTDVEIEVNGMMSYDRELIKMDIDKVFDINQNLYDASSTIGFDILIPSAEFSESEWRYTLESPSDDWTSLGFDDLSWPTGQAGFGTPDAPASIVRTNWETNELWLRKTFNLTDREALTQPYFRIHHIENVEIYLNGNQLLRLPLSTNQYVEVELDEDALDLLNEEENLLAVYAQKPVPGFVLTPVTGQYIDLGFYNRTALQGTK